jgi:hypothetical protein
MKKRAAGLALRLAAILLLALLAPGMSGAALGAGAAQGAGEAPVIERIDPYVVKADARAYLSESEIALYGKLVDAVFARKARVTLSKDYDANLRVVGALKGNPYNFFVKTLKFTGDHTAVKLRYAYTARRQREMRAFMEEQYLRLLSEIIRPGMNELEKTLAVYGYFARRIEYDYDWLEALDLSNERFLYPEIEIYQALKTNRGVCHTYTYLCEFALQQLGVECLRFTGRMADRDEWHMWLVVRIDGSYYHCDPTWDRGGDCAGLNYFGMTDQERRDSGVVNFETCYDLAYEEIRCDSDAFAAFRGVLDFSFPEGGAPHRITLTYADHTAQYDMQSKKIVT